MIITVYKKSNGEIVKNCSCLEQDILLQYDSYIENYIDGEFSYAEYYVANNIAIKIPNAPNEYCVFNYDTKQWVDPRTDQTQWVIVKNQRNILLSDSDWTQLSDVYIVNKDQWIIYRQALRDITTQTDPFNIVWPTKPE
jgi:hypothetical protein